MTNFFKRPFASNKKRSKKNEYVTKSGNTIKLNRNMRTKRAINKDARAREKAAYLATLPQGKIKRTLYRMHPKRVINYWFSREGGIMALKITGVSIALGFVVLVGIFAYFRKDLPNLRDITGNNIGGSIRYYDRTGQTLLWEDYDAVKRTPVEDNSLPQNLKDATVAVEDKDFFKHGGFDVRGITRAGVNNFLGKGNTQGGSTITQQLVKLTQNWTKDRSYTRKVKEIILSVELERTYTKKEILAGYLNTAPYGDITYGAEAATQDYFGKPAKDITLDEAAFLAAIPKSPTYYSPYGARYDKEMLVGRQHYVLDLMEQQGMISSKQKDEAKKIDTTTKLQKRKPKYDGIAAPWFVLTAKEELQSRFGAETVKRGGWKVTTTLDKDLQKLAEEEVDKGMKQVRRQGGDVAAFAAEDVKTGQMVALVGGSDFYNPEYGQNNYARSKLPPGSSFKPYDYISVIENTSDFGAGTVLYDTQDSIPGYPCTNKARPQQGGNCLFDYDFRYPGPLTLRYSLGGSRNVPAVKAMLTTSPEKTIETAGKLGLKDKGNDLEGQGYKCYQDDQLTKEAPCYGSSAIGDGAYLKLDEHVHGFASISRNGRNLPQTYILKIEDSSNKIVDEWKPSQGKQAVRDEAAYIVADMIEDPNASYLGNKTHRYKGWHFGFKTGTTNDSKDGWMMGESTQYAAGVWVGYHNRQKELSGFMETMTQPIVAGWMQKAHDNKKPEERTRPKGIQTLPAFIVRNHVGVGSREPSPATDLYPSWYKKRAANSKQTIDIVSNKLATDCTPARAKQNTGNAVANEFASDKFHAGGGGSNGTTEKDDVHKCDDAKPAIVLSGPDTCSPGGVFVATASQGTHPLSSATYRGTINFKVNGNTVQTFNVDNSPSTVQLPCTSISGTGLVTVSAEIIDSVLYDSEDSKTVSLGSGASLSLSAKIQGANTLFSWSGNNGDVYVYKTVGNTQLCFGSSSCSIDKSLAPIGTQVYAKDSAGTQITATVGP